MKKLYIPKPARSWARLWQAGAAAGLFALGLQVQAQSYCAPIFDYSVEPICNVSFADIDNTSSSVVGETPALEDYTTVTGHVNAGSTYMISLTGNSDGPYQNFFTVFFDWDQNGTLETAVPIGSFTSSVCTAEVTGTIMVPTTALAGTTRMRVVKNYNTSPMDPCGTYSFGQAEDYTLEVAIPSCLGPSNVSISDITATAANLGWTDNIATVYNYEVRTSGAGGSGATGLVLQGTAPSGTPAIALTPLVPNTNYKIYVRSDCGAGDLSDWIGPYNLLTPCVAQDVPYFENFSGVTVPALPNCMSTETIQGPTWVTSAFPPEGMTNNAALCYDYTTTDSWLFTAGLNLTAGTSYQLSFKYSNQYNFYTDALLVAFGTSPMASAMTNVIIDHPLINDGLVNQDIIDFTPATSGVYYIGFQKYSNDDTDDAYMFLDDIKVMVTPTCFPPDDVYLSNGTLTSIELTWLNSNAGSYNYEVRTSGAPGSGPTGLAFSGNAASGNTPILLSPLVEGTVYTVYVQGVCNGSDLSEWTPGRQFTPGLVEIGSGTSTTGNLPIYSCYGYSYSQQIYLASEFTGQPYIYKIAFKYNGGSSNPALWNNWTVYMGNTSQNSFDDSEWVPYSDLEQVFSGTVTPVEGEWMEIMLNPGFLWDGTSNLVVAVHENVPGYSCTANWSSFLTSSRGILFNSDNTNPDPSSPPVASSTYNSIPQIRMITGDSPTCLAPTGITVNNITTSSAVMDWTASTSDPANGYAWELRETGEPGSGTTGLADSGSTPAGSTTATSNLLEPNTTYRLYVQSDCGADDGTSVWAGPITFITPCEPTDIPYFEGFEDVTVPNIPNCMSIQTVSGLPWVTGAGSGSMTGNAARVGYTASGSPDMNSWLFTQGLNLTGGNGYRLTFKYTGGSTAYTEALAVAIGTDPSEAGMTVQLQDFPAINGTAVLQAQIDFTATADGVHYIGFKCHSIANQLSLYLDDISVTALSGCSGDPDPGMTTGPAAVCSGIPFTVGFANAPGNTGGYTYQWQTSANGTNWSDATGNSTGETYATSQTVETWYRVEMTCVNGGSTFSTPLQVTINPANLCYCTTINFTSVEPICNVTFAGIDHTSPSDTGSPAYEDFSSDTAHVEAGGTYTISATGNTNGDFTCYINAFFDWNGDGVFETNVPLGSITNDVCTTVISASVVVPADAVQGLSRMRVVKNYNVAVVDPCASYSYGQAEDYMVLVGTAEPAEDCLGVVGGPAMPGTPCISPNGFGGLWSNNCICIENVGIEEIAAKDGVAVHPNPASTDLFITTPDGRPVHVKVYDMLGQLALEAASTTHVNVAGLAPGSYSLLITDVKGDVKARTRFMKQ